MINLGACPDCGLENYAYAELHDCADGRAACRVGEHGWVDVTALGDAERRLLCARPFCGATKCEPFPPLIG